MHIDNIKTFLRIYLFSPSFFSFFLFMIKRCAHLVWRLEQGIVWNGNLHTSHMRVAQLERGSFIIKIVVFYLQIPAFSTSILHRGSSPSSTASSSSTRRTATLGKMDYSHPRPAETTRWCTPVMMKASMGSSSATHAHTAVRMVSADVHAVAHGTNPLVRLRHVAAVTLPL